MNTFEDISGTVVVLGDLLDKPSLEELTSRMQAVFGVELIILSVEGKILCDSTSRSVFAKVSGKDGKRRKLWEKFLRAAAGGTLKKNDLIRKQFLKHDFYLTPIQNELEAVGCVIFGPCQIKKANTGGPKEKSTYGCTFATASALKEFGELLRTVFDVLVFNSYKRVLTNATHLQTMAENYKELQIKNRELRQSYEQLKEMDKLKSNFLAMMSHELRTPLTSVIGYSEMLLEGIAGGMNVNQINYIRIILEKADHLLKLIKQIINLSKIEAGQMKANPEPVNLHEIVNLAVEAASSLGKERGIQITANLSAKLPPAVSLDREKVLQIYAQLLENAVKFNVDNGRVEVSAEVTTSLEVKKVGHFEKLPLKDKNWLLSSVKDTGVGIPPDMTKRIFEKFFQIDNSSTREFGGTGLGLAVVKKFVEMHNGMIWAKKAPAKGTEIYFALPLRGLK